MYFSYAPRAPAHCWSLRSSEPDFRLESSQRPTQGRMTVRRDATSSANTTLPAVLSVRYGTRQKPSRRSQHSQPGLPRTWSEGHDIFSQVYCPGHVCQYDPDKSSQLSWRPHVCTLFLPFGSAGLDWKCQLMGSSLPAQNSSIFHLLSAHEGCHGQPGQNGFYNENVAIRAWSSILVSSSRCGLPGCRYALQRIFLPLASLHGYT